MKITSSIEKLANFDIRSNQVFAHAIRHSRLPLCISDPTLPDSPIVFANEAFLHLTGYNREEIVGKNCRFLQGDETTKESVRKIRETLETDRITTVEIVNYRKDGSKFINALQIGPVYDDDGNLIFHFGSQMDVSSEREEERKQASLRTSELLHRLRNIVNVMSVVIKLTGRSETDPVQYSERVVERLVALGHAHFDTLVDDGPRILQFEQLAKTLLLAYAPLGGNQVHMEGEEFDLSSSSITPLTLLLHELATNAVKYGSLGESEGSVHLAWSKHDTTLHLNWRESGGPKVTVPSRKSGSEIVEQMIEASGGTLDFDWKKDGLIVNLTLPM